MNATPNWWWSGFESRVRAHLSLYFLFVEKLRRHLAASATHSLVKHACIIFQGTDSLPSWLTSSSQLSALCVEQQKKKAACCLPHSLPWALTIVCVVSDGQDRKWGRENPLFTISEAREHCGWGMETVLRKLTRQQTSPPIYAINMQTHNFSDCMSIRLVDARL